MRASLIHAHARFHDALFVSDELITVACRSRSSPERDKHAVSDPGRSIYTCNNHIAHHVFLNCLTRGSYRGRAHVSPRMSPAASVRRRASRAPSARQKNDFGIVCEKQSRQQPRPLFLFPPRRRRIIHSYFRSDLRTPSLVSLRCDGLKICIEIENKRTIYNRKQSSVGPSVPTPRPVYVKFNYLLTPIYSSGTRACECTSVCNTAVIRFIVPSDIW